MRTHTYIHTHTPQNTESNLCCSWSPPWSVVDIPDDTHLMKIDFLFPIKHQWKQLLVWEWVFVSTSPSQCWEFIWFDPVQSCTECHSLCKFMCAYALLNLKETVSLELSITSSSCTLSAPSSAYIPKSWWRGFDNDIPLKGEHSYTKTALHIDYGF